MRRNHPAQARNVGNGDKATKREYYDVHNPRLSLVNVDQGM